jgi:hypothetical protein
MMIDSPAYEGELSDVESDPRLQELAMRQRIVSRDLSARQAQDYVILALKIRKELAARDTA